MALQVTNFLDLTNQVASLTYTLNSVTVDAITFSNNTITFNAISSFNLVKSDMILYQQYLNTFINLLIQNFPSMAQSLSSSLSLCEYDITISSSGIMHLYYTQNSLGNSVYSINYVPTAQSGSIAARSQITITLQEFYHTNTFMGSYAGQVTLN